MTKSALTKIVMAAACWVAVGIVVACSSSTPQGINCGDGSQDCGGSCTVLARDNGNCGACGKACSSMEICSQGTCVSTMSGCQGGTTKCGNECVDNKSDPRNCGACGTACKANEVCMAGACATSCGMGTMKCGMACVNAQTDPTNCGSCGKMCGQGEACTAGVCGLVCPQGQTKCSPAMMDGGAPDGGPTADFCSNTQLDPSNCGTCGNVCPGGICNAGKCAFAFRLTQVIDGQTVTCSSVTTNSVYTECDDLKEANMYFPNGVTCGPAWSATNSSYSDTLGFCRSLTGNNNSTIEAYYVCNSSVPRTTWKNHVWGTFNDNGYTQHVRCHY